MGSQLLSLLRCEGSALMSVPLSGGNSAWRLFRAPARMLSAHSADEIPPLFAELEESLRRGCCAAGFVSYEAAPAFDPALCVHPAAGFPLAMLAIYDHSPEPVEPPYHCIDNLQKPFRPEWSETEYGEKIKDIRENIIAGNIYQANLTFRCLLEGDEACAEELFLSLLSQHPVPYAAFVNFGEIKIASLSPELFLESDGDHIFSSPMKGTAKRHPIPQQDRMAAKQLALDTKNRAENLMITDMVRNDLGRVCRPGSVSVDPLFHVDTYNTLHQMISTVHGKLDETVGLFDIFQATFPPASITGAPKISATELIRRNEISPRKVYTGSIGCFFPDRVFRLNVAIRTLLFQDGRIEMGIGGGITYDSNAEDEWREALLKSRYATAAHTPFHIFETLRWTPDHGFEQLEEHIRRASDSQTYFRRPFARAKIEQALSRLRPALENDPQYRNGGCIKFSLDHAGNVEAEATPPRTPAWGETVNLLISAETTDAADLFLYHKTTNRDFYTRQLAAARKAGYDEVIFFNKDGELTEGSISSIVLRKGGRFFTPSLECGLLPGIWRARKIAECNAVETRLSVRELLDADEVIIGNSLRGERTVAEISRSDGGQPHAK